MTLKLVVFAVLTATVVFMLANVREGGQEDLTSMQEVDATKPDYQIMLVYDEILMRQPTPVELSTQRNAITSGMKNMDGLRRELRDSDEYVRMLKTQSNALMPELPKLINDKDLFDLIAYMYKVERKKEMPRDVMLPLRDVYIYLSYNNARFRAFLRLHNYEELEAAIRRDPNFDKEALLTWMDENVDQKELNELTRAVEAEIAEQNKANAAVAGRSSAPASAGVVSAGPASCVACPASGLEGQSPEFLSYMQSKCDANKNGDAVKCPPPQKLYLPTHEGNMVLRPEYAWRMPEQRPPVCTQLGGTTPVAPLMFNSKLLLGTPLEESQENTSVGSIMPKFDYKAYIEIPKTTPKATVCKAINQ